MTILKPATFRRSACLAAALAAALMSSGAAVAGDVAVIAPASGSFEELGGQIRSAMERAFEDGASPAAYDSACTVEGGQAAAERAVADGARLIIGFLCTESLQGALPALKDRDVTVLTLNIRTDAVKRQAARNGVSLFHVTPPGNGEAEAVARLIPELWREANFAIIDDGTIGARDLALALRRGAEEKGLTPVYIDNFRPQLENQVALVERLRKAGADHVFVGGDRSDIAVIARDAAERTLALTIAGGENLRAADEEVPLPDGIVMVGLPELGETATTAGTLIVSRYYWRALAAGEIATALDMGGALAEQLSTGRFETSLGPVSFDTAGYWTGEPYGLYVSQSGDFISMTETGQ